MAAFTVTFAAPFVSIWRARRCAHAESVILYLGGGNDSLSSSPQRSVLHVAQAVLAVPAGQVLQIGTDSSKVALGLHPRLTFKQIFDRDGWRWCSARAIRIRAAHFQGVDIWSTAVRQFVRTRLGWPLSDSLPSPVDLVGCATGSLPHVLQAAHTPVPAISNPAGYSFSSEHAEAAAERSTALKIASHLPVDRPELAFVYAARKRRSARSTVSRPSRRTRRR
jgi:uncharacterized protein (DUF1501 family)